MPITNYLKIEKDIMNVEHNKLQKDYKNMEQTILKQQELEELRMEASNVYQTKNVIQKEVNQKHAQMDKKMQKQMAFKEKSQKLLKQAQKVKPFNYDSVFTKIMNTKNKILCFKLNSKHCQWKKNMQICGGM